MVELHCPVILRIFRNDETQYFIAKRADYRELFPGEWEFGGAKPNSDESIIDTIKREYREDFNVEIKFDIDAIGNPQPVGIYEQIRYYGDRRVLYKGLIFSGMIISDIKDIKLTHKHSVFTFVTWDQVKNLMCPLNCVPGFIENIKKVNDLYNK